MQQIEVKSRSGSVIEALKQDKSNWLVFSPSGASQFQGNTKELRAYLKQMLNDHAAHEGAY